jgi:eukaryotic-like serine/threonine-protein kinase
MCSTLPEWAAGPDSVVASPNPCMQRLDTLQDVVELVRRSRVVDQDRLERFVDLFRTAESGVSTPKEILGLMVAEGLLTRYQAEEFAAGRGLLLWIEGHLILERLGRGGMGEVFLAEHYLLKRRVALKILTASGESGNGAHERFVREARAVAALDHPNIVRVFGANVDHVPPFLVMEYVDGISLQAAVARHGTFAVGEVAAIGVQVTCGLEAAALAGLVHRDIKPANLLIDRKGLVKILDLGIARFTWDPASIVADASVVLGTLDYIAPEQALDSSAVDARADLYSLGATLYFLLAGHPPFPVDDLNRKMAQKQLMDPHPIHLLRTDVPLELSAVIQRLMSRDPADRYPDATAVAAALESWMETAADFPTRLFRSRRSHGADAAGAATEPGRDRDPTSLPPTRRIYMQQLIRALGDSPIPTAGRSESAPDCFAPPTAVLEPFFETETCGPPTAPLRPVRPNEEEPNSPTAETASITRRDYDAALNASAWERRRPRMSWWLVAGTILLGLILVFAAFRS